MAVKKIFSFFGSPGAGKGTLAQNCAEKLNFEILSVGNLCRKQILLQTDVGNKIEESLRKNCLIPDQLIVDMVSDWILSKSAKADILILDGFPRTILQVKLFNSFLKRNLPKILFLVINFKIPRDLALKRTLQRRTCVNQDCLFICSDNFESKDVTRCNICGSSVEKRIDDTNENLEKRFEKFPEYEKELLNFYAKIGQQVKDLNIENKNASDVYDCFLDKFLMNMKTQSSY